MTKPSNPAQPNIEQAFDASVTCADMIAEARAFTAALVMAAVDLEPADRDPVEAVLFSIQRRIKAAEEAHEITHAALYALTHPAKAEPKSSTTDV